MQGDHDDRRDDLHHLLRTLPGVDTMLEREGIAALRAGQPHDLVVQAIRAALDKARRAIRSGEQVPREGDRVSPAWLEDHARVELERKLSPSLRPVINATGVVLHTNLGRAPLSKRVLEQVVRVAHGYCNLELDLDDRTRGSRHSHVESLLATLLGVEATLVVNNCAAAVLLALSALARDREVIVSRGELIEIGGSFRIPDVMTQSGAVLREVGTTNRTRVGDYEAAITDRTALLMKAHRSNFAVVGFTEEVDSAELVELGRARGIPVIHDLGTGLLVDLAPYGIRGAETVSQELAKGLDLLTFSGDKLLGGPQAGVIVGRGDLVAKLRRHPLTRALRVDKTIIAALEATLLCYLDGTALREVPVLAMLSADLRQLEARATALRDAVHEAGGPGHGLKLSVVDATGKVGGGTLPLVELRSKALRARHEQISTEELDLRLRTGSPPVMARMVDDGLLLDARTIDDESVPVVAGALIAAVAAAVREQG